jgi:putative intracellular protease/amidase
LAGGLLGAELTHPYYELTERRIEVMIASPKRRQVVMDTLSDLAIPPGGSANDLITMRLVNTPESMALLKTRLPLLVWIGIPLTR